MAIGIIIAAVAIAVLIAWRVGFIAWLRIWFRVGGIEYRKNRALSDIRADGEVTRAVIHKAGRYRTQASLDSWIAQEGRHGRKRNWAIAGFALLFSTAAVILVAMWLANTSSPSRTPSSAPSLIGQSTSASPSLVASGPEMTPSTPATKASPRPSNTDSSFVESSPTGKPSSQQTPSPTFSPTASSLTFSPTASPLPTATASGSTTLSYNLVCNNPVTLDIGAYTDNGVITISVTGAVDVTGPPGQATLTVSGPAGSYYITSTADPGGGAQGVWINSVTPAGSCYNT